MSASIYTIASELTINGKQLFGYSHTFSVHFHAINTSYGLTRLADAIHDYICEHLIDLDRERTEEEDALYESLVAEADMIEETIDAYNAIWEDQGIDHEITSAEYVAEISE